MIVDRPKCGSRYRVGEERVSEKEAQVRYSACKTVFMVSAPEPKNGDAAGRRRSPSDLPVLAMSGVYTDTSDIMDLEDVGADDYVGKKFKPEHLLRRVRNLLESAGGN
jgi:predicted Zn finger-like uncharacterized protein